MKNISRKLSVLVLLLGITMVQVKAEVSNVNQADLITNKVWSQTYELEKLSKADEITNKAWGKQAEAAGKLTLNENYKVVAYAVDLEEFNTADEIVFAIWNNINATIPDRISFKAWGK